MTGHTVTHASHRMHRFGITQSVHPVPLRDEFFGKEFPNALLVIYNENVCHHTLPIV